MRLLRNFGVIAGLLSCLAWSSAPAQHTDRSFTTTSNDCSGVHWSEPMLKQYPTIASACQSVEVHDGVTYVKFLGTVIRTGNQGKNLTLAVKNGGEMTVAMPPNSELSINGRVTPMSSLQRGDELTFHVPQDRLEAQFYAANQTPGPTIKPFVVAPIELAEQAATQRREERRAERRAEGRETRERLATTLPATASDLPLIAVTGLLVLGLGAGLTVYRLRHR